MASNLLPCPFCGGPAKSSAPFRGTQRVWCNAERCENKSTFDVDAWNRRAAPPAAPVDAGEPVAWPAWVGTMRHIGKPKELILQFARKPTAEEFHAVTDAMRRVSAPPAASEPVYQARHIYEGWMDVDLARYEDCVGDELYQTRILWARSPAAAPVDAGEPVAGTAEFLADLARSRGKYPNNARMFDGLLGEVDELRRAYAGDGDVRSEAFDVAVCAFRIATEGDSGGNSTLSDPPAAAHGDGRSDANYAIEHGRYLANAADKFMKALNDAFDPETEETDLHDESISEARDRLASSVYEFRKRADRAMRAQGDGEAKP